MLAPFGVKLTLHPLLTSLTTKKQWFCHVHCLELTSSCDTGACRSQCHARSTHSVYVHGLTTGRRVGKICCLQDGESHLPTHLNWQAWGGCPWVHRCPHSLHRVKVLAIVNGVDLWLGWGLFIAKSTSPSIFWFAFLLRHISLVRNDPHRRDPRLFSFFRKLGKIEPLFNWCLFLLLILGCWITSTSQIQDCTARSFCGCFQDCWSTSPSESWTSAAWALGWCPRPGLQPDRIGSLTQFLHQPHHREEVRTLTASWAFLHSDHDRHEPSRLVTSLPLAAWSQR